MRDVAREAQGPGPKEVPRWLQRSAVHPFPVRGSGVEVNIRSDALSLLGDRHRSAARILSEYLSQVEGQWEDVKHWVRSCQESRSRSCR